MAAFLYTAVKQEASIIRYRTARSNSDLAFYRYDPRNRIIPGHGILSLQKEKPSGR